MKHLIHLFLKIFKLSFFIFFLFLIISLITGKIFLNDEPHVKEFEEIKLEDVLRIKSIIEKISFQLHNKGENEIEISERDINLLIGQFGKNITEFPKDSFLKVNLDEENTQIKLTIPTSTINNQINNSFKKNQNSIIQTIITTYQNMYNKKWININAELKINNKLEKNQWLYISKIKIGDINLSQNITEKLSSYLIKKFLSNKKSQPVIEAWNNITNIKKIDNKIHIKYIFKASKNSSLNNFSDLIINRNEKEKIIFYDRYIKTLKKQGKLITFISKLFSKASEKSLKSNDPVGENKALLIAIAKYYGGDNILSMNKKEKKYNFNDNNHTLYGRSDLTKYFLITAGLTLLADQGLFESSEIKEKIISLSYSDNINAWKILACRAGARLAENATKSSQSARQLQIFLSSVKSDGELLPDLGKDFSYDNEVFSIEDIEELSEIMDLYLDQNYIFNN